MNFENNKKIQDLAKMVQKKAKQRELDIDYEKSLNETIEALLEYYNDRHFKATEDIPYEEEYAGIIVQLAISSISKIGAEGETSHSEGGVSRSYDNASDYPLSLTRKIIPLAKGVDI